ncbi:very short patch repair endonuclease [Microbacterium sulfonylureivorans]|uniref:very short patch repair endonuclease n=1 Tax=Microbacterium sulfonylureivorans TaxID=2486854 RepID=UPI000FD7DE32|nr:very short patch repair endonuclease [Microbacterium sulfonylureivorans]
MVESWASSEGARRTMLANRRRDTKPELRVRRLLHAAGLRYTVDAPPAPPLRARADIVFSRRRIAVFIDGCFWHGCPTHGVQPKSNETYWRPKLARNRERDTQVTSDLKARGWTVLRFWEHEDPRAVAQTVVAAWLGWDSAYGNTSSPKADTKYLTSSAADPKSN